MSKRKSKLQTISFYIFVVAAIILVLSPILLKIDLLKAILNWILFDLRTYKSDYIALVGGMVGAGLAVSSAIYVQARSNIAKETEELIVAHKKMKNRSNVISTYIERELKMLWGLWIWARYETPYRSFNGREVPFEPYKINQDNILENFLEIEKELSEISANTFYDLFYFAEMVNGYIEYYKSAYQEEMYIDSRSGYSQGGIDLKTEYRPSVRLYEITQILSSLIDEKKVNLFFQDKSEFESWDDYYTRVSNVRNQLMNTENDVLDQINKDPQLVPKEEHFHLSSRRILDKWLMFRSEEHIEDCYIGYVDKIISLKSEIEDVEKQYKLEKKIMVEKIDSPRYSSNVEALIKDLKAM
ncbi:hypothetical protein BHU72_10710 [Desulfuribacillus stibiiarsenatis]|uniref:Uncharacterized protein n=1 Tax=Desulfuribacillus stibiiarsenatis TaxID=1390249 RepID=A0A1E5L2C3_9FIRM|nr:hypothetical protein [Desulfuribacillus stibiiarsenatis]OEH84277.1 hypothetical protein BHU72_10710 [Desulfuribacillus stibiiarsenatis]